MSRPNLKFNKLSVAVCKVFASVFGHKHHVFDPHTVFSGDVNALEEKLRLGTIPIIGRIHEGKYLLDVRTLFEADFPTIVEAVKEASL